MMRTYQLIPNTLREVTKKNKLSAAKLFSKIPILQPFIALFGSGNSIHNLTKDAFETIKANAFVVTLNYAPVHLNGHINMWSDRKVSDFLQQHYSDKPKDCLLLAQENRVPPPLKHKVDYWFDRKQENLQGSYTIVWALQLLQKYFPLKKILLFGVDMYSRDNEQAKWYDRYTDFDRKKRGTRYRANDKLNQCARQITQFVSKENVYNCNPESRLLYFEKKNWQELLKLKILHLCPSSLAGAPVHLSTIINKYTSGESKTILRREFTGKGLNKLRWDYDMVGPSDVQVKDAIEWADIVHYHRSVYPYFIKEKPSIIQFHSPPKGYSPGNSLADFNGRKLVIAQYHPRYYTDALVVPNMIDIWDDRFTPENKPKSVVTIFYSWASEIKSGWGDKGSTQTIAILKRIEAKYGKEVAVKIMNNRPYTECMDEKRKAHICIDECVTGSYHIQSLEGCSVGALTFNNIDNKTKSFMEMISGTSNPPFIKTNLEGLFDKLCSYIENKDELLTVGQSSRQWMETYWNPQKLVYRYIDAYFKVMNRTPLLCREHNNACQLDQKEKKRLELAEKNGNRVAKLIDKSQSPRSRPTSNLKGRYIEELYQKFQGKDIYIFGSGPSLFRVKPEDFRDKICFGINYSFEVMPHMDYILVHELEPYKAIKNIIDNKKLLLPESLVRHHFVGKRKTNRSYRERTHNTEAYIYPIQNPYEKNINAKNVCLEKNAKIFTWSTTTHSAIHLAAFMGAKNILLIGVDYKLYPNGKVHFNSKISAVYSKQKWNANQNHRRGDEWLREQLKKYRINLENIGRDLLPREQEKNSQERPSKMEVSGKYVQGIGMAHKVAQSPARSALFKQLFGCPLIGTFNVETSENTKDIGPTVVEGIHKFNFIKISLPNGDYRYGWSYRFDGSRQKANILEIYTKNALPDEFKKLPLKINFYKRWSEQEIFKWQKGKYWFQGFEWLPKQRADSKLLWDLMKDENYEKKTVLDFGAHYGYFSFKASKKGAIVEAIDKIPANVEMSKTINENIEHQDVVFRHGHTLPNAEYDYIFELSVYHWIDKDYSNLAQHIEELKSKCKVLYLELINPPLAGRLSKFDVDKIVGGEKLIHYWHKVRKMRTLYKVKGGLGCLPSKIN